MAAKVSASEVQKNFGFWHDQALKEPVQITKHGRETAYLVSAETFHELWASFRRAVRVQDLSESELAMIMASEIPTEHAYDIEDVNSDSVSPTTDGER